MGDIFLTWLHASKEVLDNRLKHNSLVTKVFPEEELWEQLRRIFSTYTEELSEEKVQELVAEVLLQRNFAIERTFLPNQTGSTYDIISIHKSGEQGSFVTRLIYSFDLDPLTSKGRKIKRILGIK